MSKVPKKYWDTSLFLCFLNIDEDERRKICEDNLKHARDGKLIIYTSVWTIVEVIRPKTRIKGQPVPKLKPEEIKKIQGMFEWSWLKRIQVDEKVAKKAVELCRDYSLHPADAVHAASAILNELDALQRWDKDFTKIGDLIKVQEPFFLTKDMPLFKGIMDKSIGPHPKDFASAMAVVTKEVIKIEEKAKSTSPEDGEKRVEKVKQKTLALPAKL